MLRCHGCGELVSEFAARCPQCHAGTDDAEQLPLYPDPAAPETAPPETSPPHTPAPEPAGFDLSGPHRQTAGLGPPAAAYEPAHHAGPWWPARRRPAIIVASVTVAAVVAVVLAVTAVSRPGRGADPAQVLAGLKLTGQVISDTNGTIVVSDPDGTQQVVMTNLSPVGSGGPADLSPSVDARYLATPRGDVISARGLRLDHTTVAAEFPSGYVAQPDPFAFDDRALVILSNGTQSPFSNEVSVVSLVDGRSVTLGRADDAAGDPQAFGAFVSIPEVPQPPGPQPVLGGSADGQIELLRDGSPPVVLATTSQLNTDLGLIRNQPATLTVFPDPEGDKVAIEVNPIYVGDSGAGLVVLDRTGHFLGAVQPISGPVQNSEPAWSPDGRSLAYYTYGQRGAELAVWALSGRVVTRPAPDPGDSFQTCVWSPDGSDILCPASEGATDESSLWVLGAAKGGPLVQVPAPGVPEIWLPDRS